jgi:hypothetical protein
MRRQADVVRETSPAGGVQIDEQYGMDGRKERIGRAEVENAWGPLVNERTRAGHHLSD